LLNEVKIMPNPRGTPENLQPISSDREEPLAKQIAVRITESMAKKLDELGDKKPEFVREAIQEKLDREKQS